MHKLEIGQEVILIEDGINSYRYNEKKGLPPNKYKGVITKIGRKYFTVNTGYSPKSTDYKRELTFTIDDLKQKEISCPDFTLWLDEKHQEDAYRADELYKHIKDQYFSNWNRQDSMTLQVLLKLAQGLSDELE